MFQFSNNVLHLLSLASICVMIVSLKVKSLFIKLLVQRNEYVTYFVTYRFHYANQHERSMIKLSFMCCCFQTIYTLRGRNLVYLHFKLSKLRQGKLCRGQNILFLFPCIPCNKFIVPLLACSCVMSYQVLPVLFFMLIILSDLLLALWLNNCHL